MHERSINLTPLYSFSLLTSLQVKNEETLVSQTMRPPFLTLPPPTPPLTTSGEERGDPGQSDHAPHQQAARGHAHRQEGEEGGGGKERGGGEGARRGEGGEGQMGYAQHPLGVRVEQLRSNRARRHFIHPPPLSCCHQAPLTPTHPPFSRCLQARLFRTTW